MHSTAALAGRASATCASRTSTMMSEEFAPGGTRMYADDRTLHRPEETKKEKRIPGVVRRNIVCIYMYIRIYEDPRTTAVTWEILQAMETPGECMATSYSMDTHRLNANNYRG